MTALGFILRSLLFHWRSNLAVCLAVVVGTAVLTGALLVGDSLRGSLKRLTEERLGWIDRALIGPRFIREEAVRGLPADQIAPAIVLQATASREGGLPARQVNLLGVDRSFWPGEPPDGTSLWESDEARVVLNPALAAKLDAKPGAKVTLRVAKPSDVPREALLGRRDAEDVIDKIEVTVAAVLNEGDFGARFALQPTAEAPRDAFVPLRFLQKQLQQAGRVNGVFARGLQPGFEKSFREGLDLDDWGLKLLTPKSRADALFARLDRNGDGKLSRTEWLQGSKYRVATVMGRSLDPQKNSPPTREQIEAWFRENNRSIDVQSRQLLIEPALVDAVKKAAGDVDLVAAPTLVYLANTISDGVNEWPYSVVAALDPAQKDLFFWLPDVVGNLHDGEIALLDWDTPAPLKSEPDTPITLTYFKPAGGGQYKLDSAPLTAAGSFKPSAWLLAAELTPELPGLTDKVTVADWDPPYPFDRADISRRIKSGDANERFWDEYRATPKAFVTLATGQDLWGSRFGKVTDVRLVPPAGGDVVALAAKFRDALRERLKPEQYGLVFEPIKDEALKASAGGTDFAELFLGFSFFLIAAALLLVGLMFRLGLDRRASEVGLLLAAGYRRGTVRNLLLAEGTVVALVGAAIGTGAAMGYCTLILRWLADSWPGGALRSFLRPEFTWQSLVMGFAASVLVSVGTIFFAVRGLAKVPPRALLAGQTTAENEPGLVTRSRRGGWVAITALVLGIALLIAGPFMPGHEAKAGTFFSGGALLLTAALAALWTWMRGMHGSAAEETGSMGIGRLGVRNAARYPLRSMLTAGLLASAAFLLVAVEAFRRQAVADSTDRKSPSGGFTLLAESDLPILDITTERGQAEMLEALQRHYQDTLNNPALAKQKVTVAGRLLKDTVIIPIRVRAGDDASCLNLYQPRRPRLLGVPAALIDRGGFTFASAPEVGPPAFPSAAHSGRGGDNPWEALRRPGEPFAAFGEQNTVTWMLKSGLGKTIQVPDGAGRARELRIDGLLQDSIFQSGLLLSEENFLELYPGQEGYQLFLIQPPAGSEDAVKDLLQIALADRGLEVTRTSERLETYLAVENTYLSTFQALGGLGLLLGSLGLAVVLLRGVWERRAELALFRALGYRRGTLAWMVLAENLFLLVVGLAAGTLAALIAVAPHSGGAGGVPWLELVGLLAAVLLVGLTAGALAVLSTLRAPLIPALRRE
jgi:ABC-type antimicrobial peptide transport system permease subunit